MNRYIAALILTGLTASAVMAGDLWPQFRGPNAAGNSAERNLPEKFGPNENIRWKASLPGRGLSCPVIANGKVFLTANSGMDQNRLHVLALDLATGKQLWERQFWATGQTLCHPKTCMACPTIVTDGAMVFALFATGDLVALSADGDVKWIRSLSTEYPKMTNHVGRSSSPVLAAGTLAVLMENQGDSFLFGIDPATGADKWKVNRPPQNNWNTPLVVTRPNGAEFVVCSYEDVTAYDAATGQMRWTHEDRFNPIVSPILTGDMILLPGRGLVAIKPGLGKPDIVWKGAQLGADTPTPVVHGGKIYTVARNILKCGDVGSGKQEWDLRVTGPFSASPIFADGKLFLVSETGNVIVIKPGPEPKILATNELKETILATPAVADGAIFLRSDQHLWCFAGLGRTS
jgi:outer membrane protein assembly factor BamB